MTNDDSKVNNTNTVFGILEENTKDLYQSRRKYDVDHIRFDAV